MPETPAQYFQRTKSEKRRSLKRLGHPTCPMCGKGFGECRCDSALRPLPKPTPDRIIRPR